MKDISKSFLLSTPIAHRGLHDNKNKVPENSLMAFEKAIEQGFAIEFDLQQLEDGTPVVFHDNKLERMTFLDGYISNTKPEDLKNYHLLGTSQSIPTLKEALEFIGGRTPILIEIKNNFRPSVFEKNILKLLKDYKGEVAIASFNPYVLNWFKNNAPDFFRGQLSSFFKKEPFSILKKIFIKRLKLTKLSKPHFIAYNTTDIPNRYVKKLKHLPLLAWTVSDNAEHLRVLKYCDNIIFEGFLPKL